MGNIEKSEEKTQLFTSLNVFVAFISTKVCLKQKKQNKKTLNFVLHPKTSKSIQRSSRTSSLKLSSWFKKAPKTKTRLHGRVYPF